MTAYTLVMVIKLRTIMGGDLVCSVVIEADNMFASVLSYHGEAASY